MVILTGRYAFLVPNFLVYNILSPYIVGSKEKASSKNVWQLLDLSTLNRFPAPAARGFEFEFSFQVEILVPKRKDWDIDGLENRMLQHETIPKYPI